MSKAKTIGMPLEELIEILTMIYEEGRLMNAIELKDVNYRSNAFQLQDVSFNVPKGYVTGFIGGNGAGKLQ